MIKLAGLEDTEITDPKTGKKIRISTTTRMIYRKTYPDKYGHLRNNKLNIIIAKDFIESASQVVHYFRLGKKGSPRHTHKPPGAEEGKIYADAAEIRGNSNSFFISAIRDSHIDVLTIQNDWFRPKYKGSSDNPMALGDS